MRPPAPSPLVPPKQRGPKVGPPPPPPPNWPLPPPVRPAGPPRIINRVPPFPPPPPPPANWPPPQTAQSVPPEPAVQPLDPPIDAGQPGPPHSRSADTHDDANVILGLEEVKGKAKVVTNPSGVLAWMAGKKGKKGRKDSIGGPFPVGDAKTGRPTSSIEQEEKRRRRAFLQLDPLNVHQMILKHLQATTRAPVTSAYDLSKLIANSCADVFDQYKTPPEFQFFDYFERSIGALVSKKSTISASEVD